MRRRGERLSFLYKKWKRLIEEKLCGKKEKGSRKDLLAGVKEGKSSSIPSLKTSNGQQEKLPTKYTTSPKEKVSRRLDQDKIHRLLGEEKKRIPVEEEKWDLRTSWDRE